MVTRALRNLPLGRNGNEDGPGPQRMTVLISWSPGSGAREKKTREGASHAATLASSWVPRCGRRAGALRARQPGCATKPLQVRLSTALCYLPNNPCQPTRCSSNQATCQRYGSASAHRPISTRGHPCRRPDPQSSEPHWVRMCAVSCCWPSPGMPPRTDSMALIMPASCPTAC